MSALIVVWFKTPFNYEFPNPAGIVGHGASLTPQFKMSNIHAFFVGLFLLLSGSSVLSAAEWLISDNP